MQKLMLTTGWTMQCSGDPVTYHCTIPCSVYDTLLAHHAIEDPYYRENEREVFAISEEDFRFTTEFPRPMGETGRVILCFDGIDTIAGIALNGEFLARTNNMHRRWRFDITDRLQDINRLEVTIDSPLRYITKKQKDHPLWGVNSTVPGFPHIRKAHYMFGWDWGPKLPDLGIWRDVYLEMWDDGRIDNVQYLQKHHDGVVDLTVKPTFEVIKEPMKWAFAIYDPDGNRIYKSTLMPIEENSRLTVTIDDPKLWWAHGYGDPNLYVCIVLLTDENGEPMDSRRERIGLRTLQIRQDKDEWGESFCMNLNGKDIFSMGANWIPFDNILPRCTPERQEALLQACLDANYNTVRVWGGGFYPNDAFFDFCDENGLIVWEDLMFACANYRLTDEFWATVEQEIRDNIKRLRNHPSLGLWCGNNEIETSFETWGLPENPQAKEDYIEMFERRIPAVVLELDPDRFYWRSSPSAHGGCKDTDSNSAGDMHYWDIWHGLKPFTAFRELYYRFCSEYGFESVPSLKTISAVCDPEEGDLNLLSPVMEAHHKCEGGSEKIMYYMAQMMRYPETFEDVIFASQYVQAECLRSNVEHMRRHRGRCMGSLYWQLGDSNPCISWSSIDYNGRWKAAHYYAKRFYAPVLLSAGPFGVPTFNISNETQEAFRGTIVWEMRDEDSRIVESGRIPASVAPLSAKFFKRIDALHPYYTEENRRTHYLTYRLEQDNEVISSAISLLCPPKKIARKRANIHMELRKLASHYIVTLVSDAFVPAAALECKHIDVVFSDNWFPMHANEPVNITIPKRPDLSIDLLREEITVMQ